MPSPIPPFPVRMPPELRSQVQALARKDEKSEHATLLAFIREGVERRTKRTRWTLDPDRKP